MPATARAPPWRDASARAAGRSADFPVSIAPKVLAGIDTGHRIPDTIRDRAITHRDGPPHAQAEPVERFRYRDATPQTEPLRDGWHRGRRAALDRAGATPDPRCRLRLTIAPPRRGSRCSRSRTLAGGEWPRRAREAAEALSGSAEAEEQSLGDAAAREPSATRSATTTGCDRGAAGRDQRRRGAAVRWLAGWARARRPATGEAAAALRREAEAALDSDRDDPSGKGYLREQFTEAWERWLPTPPTEAPQAAQAARQPRRRHTETASESRCGGCGGCAACVGYGGRCAGFHRQRTRRGGVGRVRGPTRRGSTRTGDGVNAEPTRERVLEAIERGEIPKGGPSELAAHGLTDDAPEGYWSRWGEGSAERIRGQVLETVCHCELEPDSITEGRCGRCLGRV